MGPTIALLLSTTVLAGGVLAGVAAVARRGRAASAPARRAGRRGRRRVAPAVQERRDARSLETKHRSRTTRPDG